MSGSPLSSTGSSPTFAEACAASLPTIAGSNGLAKDRENLRSVPKAVYVAGAIVLGALAVTASLWGVTVHHHILNVGALKVCKGLSLGLGALLAIDLLALPIIFRDHHQMLQQLQKLDPQPDISDEALQQFYSKETENLSEVTFANSDDELMTRVISNERRDQYIREQGDDGFLSIDGQDNWFVHTHKPYLGIIVDKPVQGIEAKNARLRFAAALPINQLNFFPQDIQREVAAALPYRKERNVHLQVQVYTQSEFNMSPNTTEEYSKNSALSKIKLSVPRRSKVGIVRTSVGGIGTSDGRLELEKYFEYGALATDKPFEVAMGGEEVASFCMISKTEQSARTEGSISASYIVVVRDDSFDEALKQKSVGAFLGELRRNLPQKHLRLATEFGRFFQQSITAPNPVLPEVTYRNRSSRSGGVEVPGSQTHQPLFSGYGYVTGFGPNGNSDSGEGVGPGPGNPTYQRLTPGEGRIHHRPDTPSPYSSLDSHSSDYSEGDLVDSHKGRGVWTLDDDEDT